MDNNSGKSFAITKKAMLEALSEENCIFIYVDPEEEYSNLINEVRFNPFDIKFY